MMKLTYVALTMLSLSLATSVNAGFDSNSTDPTKLAFGQGAPGPSHPGNLTIAVLAASAPFNGHSGIAGFSGFHPSVDGTFNFSSVRLADYPILPPPLDHQSTGSFNFGKVPVTQEVFFGEWAPKSAADDFKLSTHEVFYTGVNDSRYVPTSGTAIYQTKGINNYNYSTVNTLSGNLTANFGTGKLSGTISRANNATNPVQSITFTNVGISGSQFGTAYGGSVTGVASTGFTPAIGTGATTGHFFGNNTSTSTGSLAGIVTFTGHAKYDTAIGGKLTSYTP